MQLFDWKLNFYRFIKLQRGSEEPIQSRISGGGEGEKCKENDITINWQTGLLVDLKKKLIQQFRRMLKTAAKYRIYMCVCVCVF